MKSNHLDCYKIAGKLPLDKIALYFNIPFNASLGKPLILKGANIDAVLKYRTSSHQVFLFNYGCVVFINFDADETRVFLEHIRSIAGKVDYGLFAVYHEGHTIKVDENGYCKLWNRSAESIKYHDGLLYIVSIVLAKSVALSKIETDLTSLLDEAEKYIELLRKGKLPFSPGKFSAVFARMLRFQYECLNSIKIFERPEAADVHLISRESYDRLAEYYELQDRFEIVSSKINDLETIMSAYSNLSHHRSGRRLILFEVFLLSLFPLSHILHLFAEKLDIRRVISLFGW